jgi:hypothetical protein
MLGRPELLGEPALVVGARKLDLAVTVEQHDSSARRRVGAERADEPPARLGISQRVLEGGAHEIEHVAAALGELTLSATKPRDDHLTTLGANDDRDAVLDTGWMEQIGVELVVMQAARLDDVEEAQRRTPPGGMADSSG